MLCDNSCCWNTCAGEINWRLLRLSRRRLSYWSRFHISSSNLNVGAHATHPKCISRPIDEWRGRIFFTRLVFPARAQDRTSTLLSRGRKQFTEKEIVFEIISDGLCLVHVGLWRGGNTRSGGPKSRPELAQHFPAFEGDFQIPSGESTVQALWDGPDLCGISPWRAMGWFLLKARCVAHFLLRPITPVLM